MKNLDNHSDHLAFNQIIKSKNCTLMKNLFNYRNSAQSCGRSAAILLLLVALLTTLTDHSLAQVGTGSNWNNDYLDLDNDDTYAGGPLRVGMLTSINGKVWSGIAQVNADYTNNNPTPAAGKFAGLLIDSDRSSTRKWDVWIRGKDVKMDANNIRFKNTGTDGLIWSNDSWYYAYSRIFDDGNLKIQTDDNFYIQDVDLNGNNAVTKFTLNTNTGNFDLTGKISFGSTVQQHLNLYNTSYGIGVQNSTLYYRSNANFAWFKGGSHVNGTIDAGTEGTVQMALVDGKLGIGKSDPTEYLEVKPDTDVTAIIGRARVGWNGINDDAAFAHVDNAGSMFYALKHSSDGRTFLNTRYGKSISFNINGSAQMKMTQNGNLGIGTTYFDSNDALTPLHIRKDDGINGQVLVEPSNLIGQDAKVTIRGARNVSANVPNAQLAFENFDNDLAGANKLGLIAGSVTNYGANTGDLVFYTYSNGATAAETLRLTSSGEAISDKLFVKTQATIKQLEIDPDKTTWPDYVFESDYELRSLSEVEDFVDENGHLPEVPSAAEVAENGINVYEMQELMMKKIEELTLYMIDLKKENTILKSKIEQLSK